jgi:pyruvate formate lyase activating enzyme
MQCVQVCTARAIERVGEEKTTDEVMAIVSRDESYYQRTGGGLTISGGEPLLQWGFTRELARAAFRTGIPVALDTTGFASWDALSKVLEFTDLVLFDIKHLDDEQHRKLTGVSNKPILENLQKILMETKVAVWIRIPIIPGYNDSTETLARIGAYLTGLPRSIDKVSLLPFHQNGSAKYKAMGRPYSLLDQSPPSKESMEEIKRLFVKLNLETEIGR